MGKKKGINLIGKIKKTVKAVRAAEMVSVKKNNIRYYKMKNFKPNSDRVKRITDEVIRSSKAFKEVGWRYSKNRPACIIPLADGEHEIVFSTTSLSVEEGKAKGLDLEKMSSLIESQEHCMNTHGLIQKSNDRLVQANQLLGYDCDLANNGVYIQEIVYKRKEANKPFKVDSLIEGESNVTGYELTPEELNDISEACLLEVKSIAMGQNHKVKLLNRTVKEENIDLGINKDGGDEL